MYTFFIFTIISLQTAALAWNQNKEIFSTTLHVMTQVENLIQERNAFDIVTTGATNNGQRWLGHVAGRRNVKIVAQDRHTSTSPLDALDSILELVRYFPGKALFFHGSDLVYLKSINSFARIKCTNRN